MVVPKKRRHLGPYVLKPCCFETFSKAALELQKFVITTHMRISHECRTNVASMSLEYRKSVARHLWNIYAT